MLVSYYASQNGFNNRRDARISLVLWPTGILTKRIYHNDKNILSMLGMTLQK